jgi:hypothetical protein
MSRPFREPTSDEAAIVYGMKRRGWGRTYKEVQARLAADLGDPPSIGLLHRWISEQRDVERLELDAEEEAA